MLQYVELTDGTTACELTDMVSYALVSYAPTVATLETGLLGGRSPYATVVDSLVVHCLGTTAAQAYAAAAAIVRLLDTARRWWLEENSTPVIIRAQVQDSAVSPLRALVLGPPPNSQPPVILPPQWSEFYGRYVVQGLTVQFLRGGQWLANAADTAASANASHPTIHTCTFGTSATVQSPVDLSLTGATAADVFNYQQGYVLIGPSNRLNLTEGEVTLTSTSGSGTATRSTVADAAKLASAGNVQRWTGGPTFTGTINNRVTLTGTGLDTQRGPIAVFAAVRFNSASIVTGVWRAQGQAKGGGIVAETPDLPISYNSGLPQIIALGELQARGGIDTVNLQFEGVLPNTLTFDIDYIACIALDSAACRVVALADSVSGLLGSIGGANATALEIQANALSDTTPGVRANAAAVSTVAYLGYKGDPYLMQAGTNLSMILLATGNGNAWRPATSGPGAALSGVLTASRRLAYLTPE